MAGLLSGASSTLAKGCTTQANGSPHSSFSVPAHPH